MKEKKCKSVVHRFSRQQQYYNIKYFNPKALHQTLCKCNSCNSSPLNFTINICISNIHVKHPQLHLCYILESFSMTSVTKAFLSGNLINLCHILSMHHSSPLWCATNFLWNAPLMDEMMWDEMANQEEFCGLHWWPFVNDYVITASLINFAEGWID